MASVYSNLFSKGEPVKDIAQRIKYPSCKKTDCPFYGCFSDPQEYQAIKDMCANPLVYSDVERSICELTSALRAHCLACTHFEKVDMYDIIITAKAKKLLQGD